MDTELLTDYLDDCRDKQFVWGQFDCINFVNNWVALNNHEIADRVKDILGDYHTEVEANKLFKKYNIKNRADYVRELEKVGFYETTRPQIGGVCVCKDKQLGIIDFDYSVIVVSKKGFTKLSVNEGRYLSWLQK